ncbi:MAG: response regulator [Bacteroidales bacterium]|nr:response regulator [Bacteroidales bacterium]
MSEPSVDFSKINGLRILVVEDDTVSRIFLRELLAPAHVYVDYAKSGYEAMQYFAKNGCPDVVLLDLRLPDADGVDLATSILHQYPNLPIVAQTAYVSVGMEERCKLAGFKAFLAKPLKKTQLLNLLAHLAE